MFKFDALILRLTFQEFFARQGSSEPSSIAFLDLTKNAATNLLRNPKQPPPPLYFLPFLENL